MLFSAHHWRATVGEQFNTAIGVLLSGANRKAFSHCGLSDQLRTSAPKGVYRAGTPQLGDGTHRQ